MTSIRARTAALVAIGLVILLGAAGVALIWVLRAALTGRFDEALAARAEALQSLARVDRAQVELDFAGEAMRRYGAPPPGKAIDATAEYFVLWARHGGAWRTIERSESLDDGAWPPASIRDAPAGTRDLDLPGGASGRGIIVDFTPDLDHDDEIGRNGEPAISQMVSSPHQDAQVVPRLRLLVAVSRRPLDQALAAVGWSIIGVGAILALASVVLVHWGVRKGMRPLTSLSRRVQSLGPDSLMLRLEVRALPDELRPIAEQINGLLARLQAAFERERRFSAAASHELRTPLAELQTLLEVAASRPRTSDEWSQTIETALSVLARASSLCELLLRLSTAGRAASNATTREPTRLESVISRQAALALSKHGGDPRRLRVTCGEEVVARVDPAALESIVGNLIDNALRHGDADINDPVVLSVSADGGRVWIEVSNPTSRLSRDDIPHLFEPFWRRDQSRHDRTGFGLGLTVARELARAAGGEIEASIDERCRLHIRVTLPEPE